MRLAIAQIRTLPTRLDDNVAAICAAIDRADTLGAEVIVFPELAIPGYGCLDHFERVSFLERNLRARDAVVAHTATTNCAAIVGYVDRADGKSYNSAAVIHRGEQIATVDKTHLPHYDIFWESKYFEPARRRRPVEIAGRKVGIEICEDLWDESYPVKVSDALVADGAEFLINISASPFSVGKLERRRALVEGVTGRHGVPFVYVNLVGSQDGYEGETVFDGRSFAVDEKGQPLLVAPGFEEVVEMVTVPIAGPADAAASAAWPETQPIEELHDALTLGIREYLHRSGFARAIIGLSGGIDSAVVAALATEALGPESVLGVTMPSSITSDETLSDARALAANLGIRCETRSIRELVAAWETEALATHGELKSGLTRQNVQARLRGLILMEYSNEDSRALVISTGNKTELALG
ncbi:MAG: NAD(+) synthase, partial [Planctomycetota bacterium]